MAKKFPLHPAEIFGEDWYEYADWDLDPHPAAAPGKAPGGHP